MSYGCWVELLLGYGLTSLRSRAKVGAVHGMGCRFGLVYIQKRMKGCLQNFTLLPIGQDCVLTPALFGIPVHTALDKHADLSLCFLDDFVCEIAQLVWGKTSTISAIEPSY